MPLDRIVEMDLADFLEPEVKRTSFRAVAAKCGVSKGAIENIVNRANKEFPELETLQGIARGYDMPLWEVLQMVVDLELPQAPTDLGERFAAIVVRHPRLARMFDRLQAIEHKRPDLVTGMIITIEVLDRQLRRRSNRKVPLPPNPPQE